MATKSKSNRRRHRPESLDELDADLRLLHAYSEERAELERRYGELRDGRVYPAFRELAADPTNPVRFNFTEVDGSEWVATCTPDPDDEQVIDISKLRRHLTPAQLRKVCDPVVNPDKLIAALDDPDSGVTAEVVEQSMTAKPARRTGVRFRQLRVQRSA